MRRCTGFPLPLSLSVHPGRRGGGSLLMCHTSSVGGGGLIINNNNSSSSKLSADAAGLAHHLPERRTRAANDITLYKHAPGDTKKRDAKTQFTEPLSPRCSRWTYPEGEFWSAHLLHLRRQPGESELSPLTGRALPSRPASLLL